MRTQNSQSQYYQSLRFFSHTALLINWTSFPCKRRSLPPIRQSQIVRNQRTSDALICHEAGKAERDYTNSLPWFFHKASIHINFYDSTAWILYELLSVLLENHKRYSFYLKLADNYAQQASPGKKVINGFCFLSLGIGFSDCSHTRNLMQSILLHFVSRVKLYTILKANFTISIKISLTLVVAGYFF